MLNFWHTTRCTFNFILADKLRGPEADGLRMVRLQDLRKEKPDWIVSRTITLKGALRGEFTDECLALSYRWASPEDPDPDGWQLDELRKHLREKPAVKYVFVDFMCAPQEVRSPKDKIEFATILPNMFLLYLGCSVLVVMFDDTYMQRFWPQLEAWQSCMQGSALGLRATPKDQLRCTVVCVQKAPAMFQDDLFDRWLSRNVAEASERLGKDYIQVFKKSDKELQLQKLDHLDYLVRRAYSDEAEATPRAPEQQPAGAQGGSGSSGGLLSKVERIKEALGITAKLPKDVIAEANEQLGLEPKGGLLAQAEAVLEAL